ncbi:Unknown protein [Striga hermonthica]|uniref:Uncharacterized protein n=1 Tax=Striga hermonthica TaxID=68872 RepID=A0A9N7NTF3_STRHE|nr:Unknown protein [Striga hermonthica]
MGFEAADELVHRVAYASNVREIMDASTDNLEVTWEAIKLNLKNDSIWESRFHILVKLDKLREELTFLNSNADDDAILDSELFWKHILSIIEMLGTEAARQQLQFAMSILSAQPHMATPWTFM